MMKYLLTILIWMAAVSVNAKNLVNEQNIEIQQTILKDQLAEGHIIKFDFDRKMAALEGQMLSHKATQQNKQSILKGGGGTASIAGTIQVGGVNESGVELYLYEVGTRLFAGGAVTDALGEFNITNLAAGNYYLLANGYNDIYVDAMWSSMGAEQCWSCQPDSEHTITLADAENRIGIDMELVIGASISGQVQVGASPVDGVSVTMRPTDNQGFYGSAFTDISGNYTISGLPADDYYLVVDGNDDIYINAQWTNSGTVICVNCEPDPDGNISLLLGDMFNDYDLSLTVGATLTGQITDAVTSAAIETMQVSLYDPVNLIGGYYWTEFDGVGNYTLQGIPEGDYKVYLEPNLSEVNEYVPEVYNNIPCNLCSTMVYNGAGDSVTLTNGLTTSGINFALEQGASVSGAILNGSHLPETMEQFALIYLFNVSNRLIATQWIDVNNSFPTFTGAFKIGGLLPGTYFAQGGDLGQEFFQRELYDDIRCPWSGCDRGAGGVPIVLGANEERIGINFLLEYGGKISGTVTDSSTGLPLGSSNVNEYVQFYDAAGLVAGGAGINSDGTYTSQRALPPGTYSVRTGSMFTGDFNSPYVMQKYDSSGNIDCPGVTCDLTAGNVVVPAYARLSPRDPVQEAINATVTGIDFALSPAFSFSGTITELGSATPIPDVHVLVYDDNGNFANWATTDALGGFTVSGLPAGTYYALTNNGSNLPLQGYFPEEVGGWIDILFDGTPCPGSACDVTTGDPIVLGGAPFINGGGPIFDFSLSAGGTITGQVNTFGSTLPASNVSVNVYNSEGVFYGAYPSDNTGHYLTVGLPEGSYYLTTSNDGALVNAKYGGDYCFAGSCDPLDAIPVVISGNQSITDVDFDLRTDYLFKNGLD